MRISMSVIVMLMVAVMGRGVAQEPEPEPVITAPNAIIAELGGRGGLYTVTYERLLSPRNAVSGGLMMLFDDWPPRTFAVPLAYSFSPSTANFRFFLDAGATPILVVNRYGPLDVFVIPSLGLGLQYRPYTAAPVFKLEFLLADLSGVDRSVGAWPWGGIGGGHTF